MIRIKEKSGITLIALIITIIVLLILAGVSISLVVGENGIVSRATGAREKTNKAEAKERIELEVSGSYDETGTINIDDLNSNLRKNLSGVQLKNEDGTYASLSETKKIEKLPATVQYKGYDMTIEGNGEVTIEGESTSVGGTTPSIPKEPTPETPTTGKLEIPKSEDNKPDDSSTIDLGQVMVNSQELAHDWYYYYTEGDRVYLIYEDYLETNAIPTGTSIIKSGINVYASGNRDNLINYLTTQSNWNNIRTGIEEALKTKGITTTVEVTGGPTAEQLAKAYNERYGENSLTIDTTTNSTGVKYKLNSNNAADYVSVSSLEVYTNQNKVFFPHKEVSNSCYGYWLASPGANASSYVCYVRYGGRFDRYGYNYDYYGVRPVVSIQKSVFSN